MLDFGSVRSPELSLPGSAPPHSLAAMWRLTDEMIDTSLALIAYSVDGDVTILFRTGVET